MISKYGLGVVAGIALFSPVTMAQAPIKAVDVSQEFMARLPDTEVWGCGFHSYGKNHRLWWSCWANGDIWLQQLDDKGDVWEAIQVTPKTAWEDFGLSQIVFGTYGFLAIDAEQIGSQALGFSLAIARRPNDPGVRQTWEYQVPGSVH